MTGTNAFSAADLVAMIAERWTPVVLREFFAKTVAADHFLNLSEFGSSGNDIYHIPDVYTQDFTVQTQSTPGAEVTLGSPTQNDVTLTVNNHVYIAYIIGDMQRQQIADSYDVMMEYTRKAGGRLADDLEDDLFALWSGLTTNSVGDTASILSDAEVRQSVQALDARNIPLDEVAWFFHPYVYWNQVLAIQKYYDQSQFGRASATAEGTIGGVGSNTDSGGLRGQLYGIPLRVSSNVVSGLQTYRNLLAHRTAFGFAIQTPGGGVRTRASEWLSNLGVLVMHDLIDGVAEIRDEAAVVVNANSAFIAS